MLVGALSGGGNGHDGYYCPATPITTNAWTEVDCGFEPTRAFFIIDPSSGPQLYDYDVVNNTMTRTSGTNMDESIPQVIDLYFRVVGTKLGIYNYNGYYGAKAKFIAIKDS